MDKKTAIEEKKVYKRKKKKEKILRIIQNSAE